MFTAVVKGRQVGEIECRDVRHANGWTVKARMIQNLVFIRSVYFRIVSSTDSTSLSLFEVKSLIHSLCTG